MTAKQSSPHLIEVMGNTFVEATGGRHSHGIIHVNDISFVPHHFQFSLRTAHKGMLFEAYISKCSGLQAQTTAATVNVN